MHKEFFELMASARSAAPSEADLGHAPPLPPGLESAAAVHAAAALPLPRLGMSGQYGVQGPNQSHHCLGSRLSVAAGGGATMGDSVRASTLPASVGSSPQCTARALSGHATNCQALSAMTKPSQAGSANASCAPPPSLLSSMANHDGGHGLTHMNSPKCSPLASPKPTPQVSGAGSAIMSTAAAITAAQQQQQAVDRSRARSPECTPGASFASGPPSQQSPPALPGRQPKQSVTPHLSYQPCGFVPQAFVASTGQLSLQPPPAKAPIVVASQQPGDIRQTTQAMTPATCLRQTTQVMGYPAGFGHSGQFPAFAYVPRHGPSVQISTHPAQMPVPTLLQNKGGMPRKSSLSPQPAPRMSVAAPAAPSFYNSGAGHGQSQSGILNRNRPSFYMAGLPPQQ